MNELRIRKAGRASSELVSDLNPYPVFTPDGFGPPALFGSPYRADFIWRLAFDGRMYIASDADENDMVTAQTSFAATTPTFLLRVPSGTTALPLFMNLSQSGSVAGAAIDVIIEIDDVDRYSSGGTAETVFTPNKTFNRSAQCSLYSNATAAAGYGARIWGVTIGQDISPAEGAVQGPYWKPELPYMLEGPASLLIFTYAGTTAPTWLWSVGWAEWPTKGF